jgi:hypothetical protein
MIPVAADPRLRAEAKHRVKLCGRPTGRFVTVARTAEPQPLTVAPRRRTPSSLAVAQRSGRLMGECASRVGLSPRAASPQCGAEVLSLGDPLFRRREIAAAESGTRSAVWKRRSGAYSHGARRGPPTNKPGSGSTDRQPTRTGPLPTGGEAVICQPIAAHRSGRLSQPSLEPDRVIFHTLNVLTARRGDEAL